MAGSKGSGPARTSGASTGRLPSTRERRPALAALAVLLIVGGALASAWLALRAGHRADFVQVAAEVTRGEEISAEHLRTVQLPEDFEGGVPESDLDDLVGQFATTAWLPGMVLTEDMVTDEEGLGEDVYDFSIQVPVSDLDSFSPGMTVVLFVNEGEFRVAGDVLAVPEVSSDDAGGLNSSIPIRVEVDSTCGGVIAKAIMTDDISAARAGDVKQAKQFRTCAGRQPTVAG